MNYGKAIRIARSIADISQSDLASRCSLDRSYLSLIESEKRKPTVDTLQRICEGLDIPFQLLTLLAVEKGSSRGVSAEQVAELGKQLTLMLLERQENNDN